MYVTVFYLDKKFSKEKKEDIEKMLKSQSECTAAIYDCSYYIYIDNKFRHAPFPEFSRVFTTPYSLPDKYADLEEAFSDGFMGHCSIEPPIMSDFAFSSIKKEIYEFTLRDSGANIEIINFEETEIFHPISTENSIDVVEETSTSPIRFEK